MLPNHAPLVVAEQFALLEAAHPGRIDLGIGRAPGTDPVTSWALRHGAGGVSDEAVTPVPGVRRQRAGDDGHRRRGPAVQGRAARAAGHPAAPSSVPTIWLLGSSDYSARLAAEKGMPYVFAHHFSGSGTAEALALYRSRVPALAGARRAADLPDRERRRGARPGTRRSGWRCPSCWRWSRCAPARRSRPQRLVEEAEKVDVPDAHRDLLYAMRARWVIDDPEGARARIDELAATYGVDEVMVHPVAGAHEGADRRTSPGARGDPAAAGERPATVAGAGRAPTD